MARIEPVGVMSSMKDSDVANLTDDDQDRLIAEEARRLEGLLARFVGYARPVSEAVFQVRGPFSDPLQGTIHVHVLAARFDLDELPRDSDAYRVHVLEADGTTQGNQLLGGDLGG